MYEGTQGQLAKTAFAPLQPTTGRQPLSELVEQCSRLVETSARVRQRVNDVVTIIQGPRPTSPENQMTPQQPQGIEANCCYLISGAIEHLQAIEQMMISL